MISNDRLETLRSGGRYVDVAETGDPDLGPLKLLPGTWKNTDAFDGRGWNMIALPFARADNPINYRVLANQYNEELKFSLVDKAVPNRGIAFGDPSENTDQLVVTLDYEQMIKQKAADDHPKSGLAGPADLAIHHEPGLFLHMLNRQTDNLDIARLGTIPHGDSALVLGQSKVIDGPPTIPDISGLPIGVASDLNGFYLSPYKAFDDNPFKGTVTAPGFPGFNPITPNDLLKGAVPGTVKRTTILEMETSIEQARISNIPFIVRQANATDMKSIFWIMEVDDNGTDKLIMQYSQLVMLDFFPRRDGQPGLIRWPHVSINTMEKVAEPDLTKAEMPSV